MAQFSYETQADKFDLISAEHGGYYRHDFVDHGTLFDKKIYYYKKIYY